MRVMTTVGIARVMKLTTDASTAITSICFPYFTDVYPGDGGLIVIPGSHKSEFTRPKELLTLDEADGIDPLEDPVFVNITPKAGDIVIISELLTHGVLRWKPKDRACDFDAVLCAGRVRLLRVVGSGRGVFLELRLCPV